MKEKYLGAIVFFLKLDECHARKEVPCFLVRNDVPRLPACVPGGGAKDEHRVARIAHGSDVDDSLSSKRRTVHDV